MLTYRSAGKMEIKRSNSWTKLKAAVATGKVHDTGMRSTGLFFYFFIFILFVPAVATRNVHDTGMRSTGICFCRFFFVDSFFFPSCFSEFFRVCRVSKRASFSACVSRGLSIRQHTCAYADVCCAERGIRARMLTYAALKEAYVRVC
jgi:hypothetical protein